MRLGSGVAGLNRKRLKQAKHPWKGLVFPNDGRNQCPRRLLVLKVRAGVVPCTRICGSMTDKPVDHTRSYSAIFQGLKEGTPERMVGAALVTSGGMDDGRP